LDIETSEIRLDADIHLMEQAIYNLLQNAVEASPIGGQIQIQGRLEVPYVTLTITDSGSGMPFTPEFNQLSPGPSTKRLGTGLGIPFAFKICESHGGKLDFFPSNEGGTSVTMTIMLHSHTKLAL
jgi:signal transduction histidine kinase